MRLYTFFGCAKSVVCSLLALALLALAACSSPALACSCARNPTAQGILASASIVFTGVVERTETPLRSSAVTTFKVTESFKGVHSGASVQIGHFNGPSATCGVNFSPGETYTLAASVTSTPALYTTSLCSTWMFLPHVGLSTRLIEEMRVLQRRRP